MDISPILTNARIQNLLSSKLIEHLSISLGEPVSEIVFENFKNVPSTLIMNMAFIRLNFLKSSQLILIGTDEVGTYKRFMEKANSKKITEALAIALKESIEDEIQSNSAVNDLKKIMICNEEMIGILKKAEANNYLKIKISGSSIFNICIPISCNAYQPQFILESTGFSENSRILIVEDSKMVKMILKSYLNATGFIHVDEADNGKEAFQKVFGSLKKYDLVIADWHMPEMSGFELLKEVRQNSDTRTTPFILATSEQKKEEIVEAVKLKVSGYVLKPYSIDSLLKVIKSCQKL